VSPAPAGPYLPITPLVAVAWIGQRVPGLTAAQVATRLPRDLSTWADEGFVQLTPIPTGFDVDSGGRRRGLVQVDAWGVNVKADGSAQRSPALNKAWRLANLVIVATEDELQRATGGFGAAVTMPPTYLGARVLAAYPQTEPAEVPNDPSGFGRVSFDLALDWVRI